MAQFLLLLRRPQVNASDFSPAKLEEVVAQVQAWRDQLRASSTVISISKLKAEEGKILRTKDGQLVVDGPYSETKEVLGGFFLIKAASEVAAVEIAAGCPILSFGGSVELKPVEYVETSLS